MIKQWKLLLVVAVLGVSACASNSPSEETEDQYDVTEEQTETVTTVDEDGEPVSEGTTVQDDLATLFSAANLVYYFEFDRSKVKDRTAQLLDSQIPVLIQTIKVDPTYKIALEGHTDDRGSREYNLALGERRAQSISRYMRAKGVPATNIDTRSWGEDRPIAQGSNSDAWALNRRVEVILPQQ